MRVENLVSDLLGELESSFSPGDRSALLRLLQQWLKSHLVSWSSQLRDRWGLDGLATLDLPRYPIDETSLDPDEEVRQLKSVPPTSMELLAMRLRDIFWAGITVESTTVCPRCSETQLRILEDADSDAIVLSCDLCAWSQTPLGEPWRGTRPLQPAPRSRIEEWRDAGP
jgi:hypothetical protein